MAKLKVAICGNEMIDDDQLWIDACIKRRDEVSFERINLTSCDWIERIERSNADWFLLKPGGYTNHFKQLYDERVIVMDQLGLNLYPNCKEVLIYENKRFLSFWLRANKIPHPETNVFYSHNEAKDFLNSINFPIVAKTNIGASGSGVKILRSKSDALKYADGVFSGKGASKRVGPDLTKGGLFKRGLNLILNPNLLRKRLRTYKTLAGETQTKFLILQEFIPHEFEWRVVRIGDSFFAHKKLKLGEKASGSLEKNYNNPPLDLLDFVKSITDEHELRSQAVDVFEYDGGYKVNEMQCIFGQSDSFQMKVDDRIGRYVHLDGNWQFEEGDFNGNESFDTRMDFILSISK